MLELQMTGHLGQDAMIKEVNGKKVMNFSVAYTEKFKNAQGTLTEKTIWVECAWWTENLKVAEYLKKGIKVWLRGKPEARAYIDRQGKAVGTQTCRVSILELLSSNKDKQGPVTSSTPQESQLPKNIDPSDITEPVDDLPF